MLRSGLKITHIGCLALTASGCDSLYGVRRDANIEADVQPDCVRHVVETTAGVTTLKYTASHEGKGLFHPTPWVYNFNFAGSPDSNILGNLQIIKEYDGKLSYHDSLMMINQKPLQRWIDATRPVMRSIEERLALQCGVTGMPDSVKETCTGVVCKPL